MKALSIFFCLLFLSACSMPATTVKSVDIRPSISVSGVNEAADLYVDGLRIGRAADYKEPNHLMLEPGTHRVSIVEAGQTTFEQTIFIESEHKTIITR